MHLENVGMSALEMCPSSCTIISHIENDSIHHIAGDISHPYTKGKLCAKGFSYAEKNNHRDRLKYPTTKSQKDQGNIFKLHGKKPSSSLLVNY